MSEDFEASVQIGDFRIERRLGAGGMGIVYLATQVSLNRLVALKVLGPALNRDADIARFRREAQAIAKLNHPGIASIFFVGQDGQVCYLAMEFIEGVPLRRMIDRLGNSTDPAETFDAVLRGIPIAEAGAPAMRFDAPTADCMTPTAGETAGGEGGPLTSEARRLMASPAYIRRCCEIVRDASRALAHAHERGVIHRDVKPENILLDRRGEPHLIDFGIARFFEDATVTDTGALVGTPMYMSPEQVTGRVSVDRRTDVYSLGLVLYELLMLRRPITAPTREGVLRQVVTKALPPVSWRNPAVSRELEAVVHRATAKDPDERYQAATDLAADLDNWLEGRPVAAMPYRYRFDERDIAAERPPGIIPAVLVFLVIGVLSSVIGVLNLALDYGPQGRPFQITFSAACLVLGALCLVSAHGILDARRWGRLAGISTCVWTYLSLFAFFMTAIRVSFTRQDRGLMADVLQATLATLVCGTPFWIIHVQLLRPRVRAWFRLAARLRSEYKQEASSF
jgi:serine/threonine protein kinase